MFLYCCLLAFSRKSIATQQPQDITRSRLPRILILPAEAWRGERGGRCFKFLPQPQTGDFI